MNHEGFLCDNLRFFFFQDNVKFGVDEMFQVIGFPSARSKGKPEDMDTYERIIVKMAREHPVGRQLYPTEGKIFSGCSLIETFISYE